MCKPWLINIVHGPSQRSLSALIAPSGEWTNRVIALHKFQSERNKTCGNCGAQLVYERHGEVGGGTLVCIRSDECKQTEARRMVDAH